MDISKTLDTVVSQANQNKSAKDLPDSQQSTSNTQVVESKYTPVDVQQLGQALGACLLVQRTYGKQGGDVDKITKIFLKVLDTYEPQKVIDAVKQWIKSSPEFPTPSDIESILNPQPIFTDALYREAKKRIASNCEKFSDAEYCRKYESQAMKGV